MLIKNGIAKAVNTNTVRFFMPGNKGLGSIDLKYDVTELSGTDNLQNPQGIIKESLDHISKLIGSLHTLFSVNGSSGGLMALILSVCNKGDTIIMDRACHVSVINTLILFDIHPVFIYPEHNNEFGINGGVSPQIVEDALIANPEAKAVFITSPTYYGICSNIYSIANIVHRYNKILLVDEAHGAHFGFHKSLPHTAIQWGADGTVQSAHKTLNCMTQGAVIHIGTPRIDIDKLRQTLNMLQTTSPSYLLMSSIEEGYISASKDYYQYDSLLKKCEELRKALNNSGKYKCLDTDDKTRIVINTNEDTIKICAILKSVYNIIVEMDDGHNMVLIATPNNKKSDFIRFEKAMLEIAKDFAPYVPYNYKPLPRSVSKISPHDAFYSDTVLLSPQNAIGKVAARCIYKTPPCMPLICPGEILSKEIIDILVKDNIGEICCARTEKQL